MPISSTRIRSETDSAHVIHATTVGWLIELEARLSGHLLGHQFWHALHHRLGPGLACPLRGGVRHLLHVAIGGIVEHKNLSHRLISALLGDQWGATVIPQGLVQGLGAELAFAALRYRSFRLPAALLAGALTGLGAALFDFWRSLLQEVPEEISTQMVDVIAKGLTGHLTHLAQIIDPEGVPR